MRSRALPGVRCRKIAVQKISIILAAPLISADAALTEMLPTIGGLLVTLAVQGDVASCGEPASGGRRSLNSIACRTSRVTQNGAVLSLRGGQMMDASEPRVYHHDGLAKRSAEHMRTSLDEEAAWKQLSTEVHDAERKDSLASGAAAQHSHAARDEAVRKLLSNHRRCVLDMTNPYARSQAHLARLPLDAQADADAALLEVARRLAGRPFGAASADLEGAPSGPTSAAAAKAWAHALDYLEKRLQVASMPQIGAFAERPPDMSAEAGAALSAVLREVGSLDAVLTLRGGTTDAASALLSLRGGSEATAVIGLNLASHAGYGLVCLLAPKALLSAYDWSGAPEQVDFVHPAHGLSQFMGSLQIFLAYGDLCALGCPGLPARNRQAWLRDLVVVHSLAAAVGAYRTVKGLTYSAGHALATPLPGSLLSAALCWHAAKKLT